jgi:hypothetical protein
MLLYVGVTLLLRKPQVAGTNSTQTATTITTTETKSSFDVSQWHIRNFHTVGRTYPLIGQGNVTKVGCTVNNSQPKCSLRH